MKISVNKLFFQAIYTIICFVYIAWTLSKKIPILNYRNSLPRNFSLYGEMRVISRVFFGIGGVVSGFLGSLSK